MEEQGGGLPGLAAGGRGPPQRREEEARPTQDLGGPVRDGGLLPEAGLRLNHRGDCYVWSLINCSYKKCSLKRRFILNLCSGINLRLIFDSVRRNLLYITHTHSSWISRAATQDDLRMLSSLVCA